MVLHPLSFKADIIFNIGEFSLNSYISSLFRLLFLYRYYLCSFTEDIEKALNDALELNSMFRQTLSEREVIRATRSAERCYLDKNKQYKYKNETLIELLEITEEEQKYMIIIISKKEYKRRENIRGKKNYQEQLKAQGKVTKKRNYQK